MDEAKEAFMRAQMTKHDVPQQPADLLPSTPRIPVRVAKESPSAILANLTPIQRSDLRCPVDDETAGSVHGSPSALRTLKRRVELVADQADLDRIEDDCRAAVIKKLSKDQAQVEDGGNNHDGLEKENFEMHERMEETQLANQQATTNPPEEKKLGLFDMLSKLSSKPQTALASTSTAGMKRPSIPVTSEAEKSRKQTSLSGLLKKP